MAVVCFYKKIFMKDLFEGVEIQENLEKTTPHRRLCHYCYKWYETNSNFGNKCPEHKDKPDRKLILIKRELPF